MLFRSRHRGRLVWFQTSRPVAALPAACERRTSHSRVLSSDAPGAAAEAPLQNENLSDPCITRGERVARGVPKVVLVWTPLASKVMAPLMSVKLARLNRL